MKYSIIKKIGLIVVLGFMFFSQQVKANELMFLRCSQTPQCLAMMTSGTLIVVLGTLAYKNSAEIKARTLIFKNANLNSEYIKKNPEFLKEIWNSNTKTKGFKLDFSKLNQKVSNVEKETIDVINLDIDSSHFVEDLKRIFKKETNEKRRFRLSGVAYISKKIILDFDNTIHLWFYSKTNCYSVLSLINKFADNNIDQFRDDDDIDLKCVTVH